MTPPRGAALSPTLSVYLGALLAKRFLLILGAVAAVILIFDFIELLRRGAERELGFALTLRMAVLKAPEAVQETIPFVGLLAGIGLYRRLEQTRELAAASAAGSSPWQLLLPSLAAGAMLGAVAAGAFNPLAAVLLARFGALEQQHLRAQPEWLGFSGGGVWLREAQDAGETIFHAGHLAQDRAGLRLSRVMVLLFDVKGSLRERIDADQALLLDGRWQLTGAIARSPGQPARHHARLELASGLAPERLLAGIAPPEAIPFWQLPGTAAAVSEAGISPLPYRIAWHRLAARPALLAAVILLAAALALLPAGRAHGSLAFGAGILAGFLLYFFADIAAALALAGKVPVVLAAWAPVIAGAASGAALLLHLEDR